jgi:hypothetical protein
MVGNIACDNFPHWLKNVQSVALDLGTVPKINIIENFCNKSLDKRQFAIYLLEWYNI